VNARTFFAPNSREIRAFVVVEGAAVGNKLRGAWYQLGTPDAGAVGQEINSSDITLDEVQDGRSLITFTLSPGQGTFPEDSWLLRVYSGDKLLRTSAFIVTRFAQVNASPPAGGSPAATATPTSYTVTSGDTLNSIATRFKPANEDQTAFLNRMAQLNNIPANSTLQPGQVIRVPGANP
jgi:LysM repeat protein